MIKWPGNSPDLNPIENAWSWMKLRESTATNMQEWQRDITELWAVRMNDSQFLKDLVEFMSRHLQEVIQREGNCTQY